MNIDSQAIATIIAAVISLFAGAALFRFKLNAKKRLLIKLKETITLFSLAKEITL